MVVALPFAVIRSDPWTSGLALRSISKPPLCECLARLFTTIYSSLFSVFRHVPACAVPPFSPSR
ncbi:hypothetical protein BKA56DRAFT_586249 [Ilyonectria sp. MPI-CAGE-AT-0026]|nr:hypothetical protein BKA56DRAFT_586249 [Ilyonectria sp. MPI-CAGE-AT-0026]